MISQELPYQDARNRTIAQLFTGASGSESFTVGYPAPIVDIPFRAATNRVSFEQQATFIMGYSELGASYQLYIKDTAAESNDDATPVGTPFIGIGDALELKSAPILVDSDFVIKVTKTQLGKTTSSWLNNEVRITVGLDLDIGLSLLENEIDYLATTTVILAESQAGVTYSLYNGDDELIGGPELGNEASISITSSGAEGQLKENTLLRVKALRADAQPNDTPEILTQQLLQLVRANPEIGVGEAQTVIDYNASLTLVLENTQESVQYRVFGRPLEELEYWQNQSGSAPSAVRKIDIDLPKPLPSDLSKHSQVRVLIPPPLSQGKIPTYFQVLSSSQAGTGGTLTFTIPQVKMNLLFVVLAEKAKQKQPVVLSHPGMALLRPNPALAVSLASSTINPKTRAEVRIANAQRGVKYYLLAPDNSVVGTRRLFPRLFSRVEGKNIGHRIGRLKLGVDLFVGPQPQLPLRLFSPPLTQGTTFRVLAVDSQTLLSVVLNQSVAVQVSE